MNAPGAEDGRLRVLNGNLEIAAVRLQLLVAAQHCFALHLPRLAPQDYASDAELAEIRRVATSGRRADIRILLHDPGAAVRDDHRLLALFQRLSSSIHIRMPVDDVDRQRTSAWLTNDAGGYLLLPDATKPTGRSALRDRPAQVPLVRLFDEIWERSSRASELESLNL
ncbi:MAG: hypothetical protein EPN56_06995 [Rhodanobacter sp.]|nr:MAG: hypothetical protein EPN78_06810 [Rhodanobacter sp.]TAM08679.1 MAG: hypothetical protein EPN66_12615 [Rhodanobacter sp.]TAM36157.1 MAG: hypothetical protein EPN56_06995 [Rhodanobacter sp.]